eukprot:scaffold6727_cov106-Isochrysis_galbana.AAC.9
MSAHLLNTARLPHQGRGSILSPAEAYSKPCAHPEREYPLIRDCLAHQGRELIIRSAEPCAHLEREHLLIRDRLPDEGCDKAAGRQQVDGVDGDVRGHHGGRRRRCEGQDDQLLRLADEDQIEELPARRRAPVVPGAKPAAQHGPPVVLPAGEAALARKVGSEARAPRGAQRRHEQQPRVAGGRPVGRAQPVPAAEHWGDGPELVDDG